MIFDFLTAPSSTSPQGFKYCFFIIHIYAVWPRNTSTLMFNHENDHFQTLVPRPPYFGRFFGKIAVNSVFFFNFRRHCMGPWSGIFLIFLKLSQLILWYVRSSPEFFRVFYSPSSGCGLNWRGPGFSCFLIKFFCF